MKANCSSKSTFNKPQADKSMLTCGKHSFHEGSFGGRNARKKGRPFGKLNCTNVAQVLNSEKVVIGTLNILTNPGKVLFDTGATTSFIAQEFVDEFRIRCSVLETPITILSAGGKILVTHIKEHQVIMIFRCEYVADLFVIPMKDITVSLGMDW